MRKQVLASVIGILLVLSVFSVLTWQIKPVEAVTLFQDGQVGSTMETVGDFSAWTSTSGSPSVVTTQFHHGGNCSEGTTSGAWVYLHKTITASATVYAQCFYYFDSLPADGSTLELVNTQNAAYTSLTLKNNSGTYQFGLWPNTGVGSYTWFDCSPQPAVNIWYRIDYKVEKSGEVRVYLDGLSQGNVSGVYTADTTDIYIGGKLDVGSIKFWIDCVTIGTTFSAPVTFDNIEATSHTAGTSTIFHFNCTADSGAGTISHYIFGWDNGTTMTNDTAVAFSTSWANITKTLNSTVGTIIHYILYANYTNDKWTNCSLQSLTTLSSMSTYLAQYYFTKQHTAGATAQFCVRWDAATGTTLSFSICESNVTGSVVNETAFALSGTSAWHNQSVTLPVYNTKVGFLFYANSSTGVWSTTLMYIFVTMNGTMGLHSEGEYVYDDVGNIVTFRGFGDTTTQNQEYYNGHWFGKGASPGSGYNEWNVTAIEENLDAMAMWGANTLRYRIAYEWWATDNATMNCKTRIQQFCTLALSRGIYIMLNTGLVNITQGSAGYLAEYDGSNSTVPWPPYLTNANSTMILPSAEEWIEWYTNVSKDMASYSNFIIEFHNEPNGDASGQTWYLNGTNYAIPACRNETDQMIVVQWGYATVKYPSYSMSWVDTIACNGQWNILYSTHLYRDGYDSNWDYEYSTLLTEYETYMFAYTIDVHKPLVIGEIGCNIWLENDPSWNVSGQLLENAWFNNSLYIFNQRGIGNLVWWWYFYGPYSVFPYPEGSTISIARPLCNGWGNVGYLHGDTGNIAISQWHTMPFVFSVGSETLSGAYYVYSNNTAWSSTWASNQLTVTYTGATQVRVFWNVSATYPLNNTLQCYNSNGTSLYANTVYDTTTNLIRLNSTASGIWTIGYGFPPITPVIVITNPTNTTYSSSIISVSLSATGGTIDTIWYNCKNGTTWIYGSNQTYTVATSMTGFVNGTTYSFYAWANNTEGNSDEETVMFSVQILTNQGGTTQLIVNVWWSSWW